MKFEDLKLPQFDLAFDRCEDRDRVARAVYGQMREYYEAKLAEAKPEPEELFEHPNKPGKKFRKLKVGELRERTDFACSMNPNSNWVPCATFGYVIGEDEACHYYREVPQLAPEWRLPDPPPGKQWHRDDWTQDMLPEGYRPLLLGEVNDDKDEGLCKQDGEWALLAGVEPSQPQHTHLRTRRPLPAPVEYVPLEPGDVPPGSAVRKIGEQPWRMIVSCDRHSVWTRDEGASWTYLFQHYEILRPNSTTWEPCKKPKA